MMVAVAPVRKESPLDAFDPGFFVFTIRHQRT